MGRINIGHQNTRTMSCLFANISTALFLIRGSLTIACRKETEAAEVKKRDEVTACTVERAQMQQDCNRSAFSQLASSRAARARGRTLNSSDACDMRSLSSESTTYMSPSCVGERAQ